MGGSRPEDDRDAESNGNAATALPADPALLSHIEIEFGDHGRRAVEFLGTAADLLAIASGAHAPRLAETVAYCLREAMKAIPASHQVEQVGQWRTASRAVADSRRRYELVRGIPGEDADGALRDLLLAIDELDQIHGQEGVHQRRLIAIMVSRTGATPLSAGTGPVRRYQELLEELDSALHNSVAIEEVVRLWDRCIQLLRQLFLPPDLRHRELAELAGNPSPGEAEVDQVFTLLAGSNHLQFFLARVAHPDWLEKLTASGVLDPPRDNGPWPVFAAIERLTPTHESDVAAWLQRMYARHSVDPTKCWFIARAAIEAGPDALPIVVQSLSAHRRSPALAHLGLQAAKRAAAGGELVEELADLLLNQHAWRSTGYVAPVLEQLLDGLNHDNCARRIQLLCWKLGAVSDKEGSRRRLNWEHAGSIGDWPHSRPDDRFGCLLRTLVAALCRAWGWLSVDQILSMVDSMPGGVRSRVRAWTLASAPAAAPTQMIEELTRAISTRKPTGDDLALLDRVVAGSDPSLYEREWTEALGDPPAVPDVAQALASQVLSPSVRRSFSWSGILPEPVQLRWSHVVSVIGAVYGPPSRAALEKPSPIESGWGRSPISADELGVLPPIEAAQLIAAWRPDGSHWLASARELARVLEQLLQASPVAWLADPLRIATELKHPTYIHHYLRAAASAITHLAEPPVGELLDVIALVRAHPWTSVPLGRDSFEYDDSWDEAERAGVELVKALAERDLGFAQRDNEVWALLDAEAHDRSELPAAGGDALDPLEHAINRRCTQALDAILAVMAHEFRTSAQVRPRALAILDEALSLEGTDGAEHRAIVATRLGFLQHVAPAWFEMSTDLLFGQAAPADLAQLTADQAIKWGRPNRWLHEHRRELVRDAVQRDVENAVDHLLTAMLWGVPGYTIDETVAFLRQPPSQLSSAGETLGRLLQHEEADPSHITTATEFWQAAVDVAEGVELLGFGWMAEIEKLDDATWAILIKATLSKTGGKIDWAHKVAERTASLLPSATTLSIMNHLVRGTTDEWDRRGNAEKAVEVLNRAEDLAGTPDFERLRTTLLERGAM